MKRLTAILALCIFVAAGVQSAMATTWVLDPGATSPEILVLGTWGTGPDAGIFTLSAGASIVITQDNLTLEGNGYTIKGAGSANGITLSGVTGVTVKNVTVDGFDTHGIKLDGASGNWLIGNTLVNNGGAQGGGIRLHNSSDGNTIRGNTSQNNYFHILFHTSTGNYVYNNNFLSYRRSPAYPAWIDNASRYDSAGNYANYFYKELEIGGGGGGNHWLGWASDDPYVVKNEYGWDSGEDKYPWTEENGWNVAPIADAGSDHSVGAGEAVTLDGSGSSDLNDDHLYFSWLFTSSPSGSTATLSDPGAVDPVFTADMPGSYTVQLIVNDGIVDSTPDDVIITVGTLNSAPQADAGEDQLVHQTSIDGADVTLDGSASSDPDLDDELTYKWFEGSGSTALATTAVYNVPLSPGTHTFRLEVSDGLETDDDTVEVTVYNNSPTANAGGDQVVTAQAGGLANVTLDGTGSSDPDQDPLTYIWSEGPVLLEDAEGLVQLEGLGPHTIVLTVSDGLGDSAIDDVVITLEDKGNPEIACPRDITLEARVIIDQRQFTIGVSTDDQEVTNFLTDVSATDDIDTNVKIENDLVGSTLALGSTLVTFTATDASYNSSACTATITVEGAKRIKKNALALLLEVDSGNDKRMNKYLEDAVKYIRRSLGTGDRHALWADEMHLNPRHGKKVFDYEKRAVDKLRHVMKCRNVARELVDTCETVIDKLWTADHLLAVTAYLEAVEAENAAEAAAQKKIAREVDKCEEEIEKAYKELDKGHMHHSIDRLKKVWEHAQHALKKAADHGHHHGH